MALEDVGANLVIKGLPGFLQGMSQVGNAVEQNNKSLQGLSTFSKTAGIQLTVMGASALAASALMVHAATDVTQAQRLLDQALKNVGTSFEAQKEQINATTAALQRKTNYSDTDQLRALTQLVTITGSYEAAIKALPLALDIAANKETDLNGVSVALGKALNGNVAYFQRYGIELKANASQTEVNAELTQRFGGSAEAAANPTTQLKNALSDLAATGGQILLPVVKTISDFVANLARGFKQFADEHPNVTKVLVLSVAAFGAFATIAGTMLLLLPGLISGFTILSGILLGTAAAEGAAATAGVGLIGVLGPVGLVAALGLAVSAFYLFRDAGKAVEEQTKRTADAINLVASGPLAAWNRMHDISQEIVDLNNKLPGLLKASTDPGGNIESWTNAQKEIGKTKEKVKDLELELGALAKAQHDAQAATAAQAAVTNAAQVKAIDDAAAEELKVLTSNLIAKEHLFDSFNESEVAKTKAATEAELQYYGHMYDEENALAGDADAARLESLKQHLDDIIAANTAKEEADAKAQQDAAALAHYVQDQFTQELGALIKQQKAWGDLANAMKPATIEFEKLGGAKGVVEALAEITGKSADDIITKLQEMGIKTPDEIKDHLADLAKAFGTTMDKIETAVAKTAITVGELEAQFQSLQKSLAGQGKIVTTARAEDVAGAYQSIVGASAGRGGPPVTFTQFAELVAHLTETMGSGNLAIQAALQKVGNQFSLPGFAMGGQSSGGPAWLAENGPELVRSLGPSQITPISRNVTYNVTANYADRQEPSSISLDLEALALSASS